MQMTLTIDDGLAKVAKDAAAKRSVSVDRVVSELLEAAFRPRRPNQPADAFPVFAVPPGTPSFGTEDVLVAEAE